MSQSNRVKGKDQRNQKDQKNNIPVDCSMCGESTHDRTQCLKYKVLYCSNTEKTGICKMGAKCRYAHNAKELRRPKEMKCQGTVTDIKGTKHTVGCGGMHKFELCKKRKCEVCEYNGEEWSISRSHWMGEGDCLWCRYCKKNGHMVDTCYSLDCGICHGRLGRHNSKTCPEAAVDGGEVDEDDVDGSKDEYVSEYYEGKPVPVESK